MAIIVRIAGAGDGARNAALPKTSLIPEPGI